MASSFRVVDCSQTIDTFSGSVWPGCQVIARCPFHSIASDGFANEAWTFGCDCGTHTDSPSHFIAGERTITGLQFETDLIAPGVVINVTEQAKKNHDYALSLEDVLDWERQHGPVPKRAFVCCYSGWGAKFPIQKEYENGMRFPGFSLEAVEYLVSHADIVGVGIDTLSLDIGSSSTFPVHSFMLGKSKFQIENMVLDQLPPKGFLFVNCPLKIDKAPESPSRVVGLVPNTQGGGPADRFLLERQTAKKNCNMLYIRNKTKRDCVHGKTFLKKKKIKTLIRIEKKIKAHSNIIGDVGITLLRIRFIRIKHISLYIFQN